MNDDKNKIPLWLLFFNLALLISCLLLVFFIYSSLHSKKIIKIETTFAPKVVQPVTFDNINILAKSALVFDRKTILLFIAKTTRFNCLWLP